MSEFSIIVPCRNNAPVLMDTLDALHRVVAHHSLSVETLIVDDESEDDTVEIATRCAHQFPALHIRVLARKRLQHGLGGILRYGMAFALGRYCVLVSPDGSDPVDLLPTFLFHLRAGKQLVQCSRSPGEQGDSAVPAIYRWCRSLYRAATRLFVGADVADTTNPFRAFDRVFVQALGLSCKHYDVCPEMTFKVILCGGVVENIPGKSRPVKAGAERQFYLPLELWGYALVLLRAGLHRAGLVRWF